MTRCPLCWDPIAGRDDPLTCAGCSTQYHRPCHDELGGCGTIGCERVAAPRASGRAPAKGASAEPNGSGLLPGLLGLVFALGLGAPAAWSCVRAVQVLREPAAYPGDFPDCDDDDLRLVALLAGGLAAFAGLIGAGSIKLLREGVAPPVPPGEGPPEPMVAVSAVFLVQGRATTAFGYISPEKAGPLVALGGGCGTALALSGLASFLWWRVPTFAYVIAGLLTALVLAHTVWALRSWLAAQRLRLRFLDLPASARAGEPLLVSFEVLGRAAARIDTLRVVLACVEQVRTTRSVGRGRSTTTRTTTLLHHHHVVDCADGFSLAADRRRRCRVRLQVPPDALPTLGDSQAGRKRCWIVGLVAELPRWPDYELAAEVRVLAAVESRPA